MTGGYGIIVYKEMTVNMAKWGQTGQSIPFYKERQMRGNPPDKRQRQFLYEGLADMLNPQEPIYKLANETDWDGLAKNSRSTTLHLYTTASSDKANGIAVTSQSSYDIGDEKVVEQ